MKPNRIYEIVQLFELEHKLLVINLGEMLFDHRGLFKCYLCYDVVHKQFKLISNRKDNICHVYQDMSGHYIEYLSHYEEL